ncbi:Dockerin type 1 protein [Hyella patelloides LEGE 07179]|uniref:Dockerin type 1 protein n=1 Tax=Hyella patelloides LEGE 07179 TaxID=945734 RepID=A0A563VMV9_9CYAN|nr:dockerin type I domain-containing protein [Hyella patelloides]VEP12758.1 Dockerin type 1 protein [Hyella patelloides LEGE 07179]
MKIEFDYRFDTNGFFDAPERRAALEYAGEIWSNLLQDDFEAIPVGAEFTTTNPATGEAETIVLDTEIDDLLIFVGSNTLEDGENNPNANLRNSDYHLEACCCSHCSHHSGKTVNLSQPGVLEEEEIIDTDSLLAQAQVNGTDLQGDIFQRRVTSNFRDGGVATDFEPWAGTISFSGSDSVNWNFDLENTDDSSIDFVSVTLHEIGHILGIGVAPIFDSLGASGSFTGVNAVAANNGAAIPLENDLSHVVEGFSGNGVLLDPLLNENRSLPSDFDLAILADIGYEIAGFTKQGFTPEIATDKAEEIVGSNVNDVIDGLAGNDLIQANDGNDTVNGGVGNDSIFGTAGEDFLFGDVGIDSLHGGLGRDTLDGGADNDLLVGAEDNDLIFGRDGDDELQGNAGEDTIQGGVGDDTLFGHEDADFLLGNRGNDRIQGGIGDDSLKGHEDNDTILGQEGNDILDGGTGDDVLVGGADSDRFFFGINNGNDTINDFTVGEDTIEIAADLGFNNANEVLAAITNSGATTNPEGLFSEVTLSEGNTINIFHNTDLIADSFSIVTESSISASIFNIVNFTPNSSGFTVNFDDRLNTEVLDLSDLTLVPESTGEEVAGSLVWDESSLRLSFVSSGGILESDRYNLTLASEENSFISETGELLDGDNNSLAGGDFVTQFTIDSTNQRVLALDDFNVSTGEDATLDISLDNGANITKAEFTVTYNPDILSISDVVIDAELTDDWTITTEDLNTPGMAIITVEGTTALDSGEIDLVQLQATIPDTATYGVSDLITIEDISLNEGNITATGDTAVQQVALIGDVNGDGSYSSLDSYLISQMAVGLSDSLDAFPVTDPLLLADINQDGTISALDSFLVAQEIN